eukprot:scaffold9170_cov28-Tisochrysis_lutea.AAC.2
MSISKLSSSAAASAEKVRKSASSRNGSVRPSSCDEAAASGSTRAGPCASASDHGRRVGVLECAADVPSSCAGDWARERPRRAERARAGCCLVRPSTPTSVPHACGARSALMPSASMREACSQKFNDSHAPSREADLDIEPSLCESRLSSRGRQHGSTGGRGLRWPAPATVSVSGRLSGCLRPESVRRSDRFSGEGVRAWLVMRVSVKRRCCACGSSGAATLEKTSIQPRWCKDWNLRAGVRLPPLVAARLLAAHRNASRADDLPKRASRASATATRLLLGRGEPTPPAAVGERELCGGSGRTTEQPARAGLGG